MPLSTNSISVSWLAIMYWLAPAPLSICSSRPTSLGSREVVRAMRIGIPKISPKESQNASMFFFGMVCVAALRYSPRSSGCPASMSQSENGAVR